MNQQSGISRETQSGQYFDSVKLRALVHDLLQEHERLRLPLIKVAATGAAMRDVATALDDLAAREDRELLPRLERILCH